MMVRVCLCVCVCFKNSSGELKVKLEVHNNAPDTNSSVHHSGSVWTQNYLHCPGAFCIWCVMGETLAVSQTLTGGLSQWILTHVKLSYQTPSLHQKHDTYHHLPQQNTKRVSYLSPWPNILPWFQYFFSLSSIKPRPDYRHHFLLTSDAPPTRFQEPRPYVLSVDFKSSTHFSYLFGVQKLFVAFPYLWLRMQVQNACMQHTTYYIFFKYAKRVGYRLWINKYFQLQHATLLSHA